MWARKKRDFLDLWACETLPLHDGNISRTRALRPTLRPASLSVKLYSHIFKFPSLASNHISF